MKLLLSLAFFFSTISVFSQGSGVVVFSERGDTFVLHVNGKAVNGTGALALVRSQNLTSGKNHIRVSFTKKGVPELNSEVNIPKDGNLHELSYKVVPSVKGPYALVLVSDLILGKASAAGEVVSNKPNNDGHQDKEKDEKPKGRQSKNPENAISKNEKVNDTVPGNSNVHVSIGSTGNGENVQLTMSADAANSQQNNNATLSMSVTGNASPQGDVSQQQYSKTQVPQVKPGLMCGSPSVSQQAFMQFKYKISSSYLDLSKSKDAKDFMNNNCMLAHQVAELIKLVQLNETQLDLAEFGFLHTYDQANFGLVVDALLADYNKEKLLAFIGSYGNTQATPVIGNNASDDSNTNYTESVTITNSANNMNSNSNQSSNNTANYTFIKTQLITLQVARQ